MIVANRTYCRKCGRPCLRTHAEQIFGTCDFCCERFRSDFEATLEEERERIRPPEIEVRK